MCSYFLVFIVAILSFVLASTGCRNDVDGDGDADADGGGDSDADGDGVDGGPVGTGESITEVITDLVDPFIGTDAHGHTYPGARLPFGMVQLSPDTYNIGWCRYYEGK